MRGYKIFSGTANPEFAKKISKYLSLPLSECAIKTFSDGEISVQIGESVRGKDVFVIQPTCAPANSNLMELLILTDALKRSSANSITAVVPYFGYARQDRKAAPRVPADGSHRPRRHDGSARGADTGIFRRAGR